MNRYIWILILLIANVLHAKLSYCAAASASADRGSMPGSDIGGPRRGAETSEVYLRAKVPRNIASKIMGALDRSFLEAKAYIGANITDIRNYHITLNQIKIYIGNLNRIFREGERRIQEKNLCPALYTLRNHTFEILGYDPRYGHHGVLEVAPHTTGEISPYVPEKPHISLIKAKGIAAAGISYGTGSEEEIDARIREELGRRGNIDYSAITAETFKINEICIDRTKDETIACATVETCNELRPDLFKH